MDCWIERFDDFIVCSAILNYTLKKTHPETVMRQMTVWAQVHEPGLLDTIFYWERSAIIMYNNFGVFLEYLRELPLEVKKITLNMWLF